MRIQDNLMMSDQHLVQLLKLDAIGADVLSEEKEKQLRYVDLNNTRNKTQNKESVLKVREK